MNRIVFKEYVKTANKIITHKRSYSNHKMPQQAGFGKILLISIPIVATGGIVAYAKYDSEFRKTLVQNVPGSDKVLKILLQEENPFSDLTKKFDDLTGNVTKYFSSSDKPDTKIGTTFNNQIISPPKTDKDTKNPSLETKLSEQHSKATIQNESKPVEIKANNEKIPEELADLEKVIEISASLAVDEYNKAIKILKVYNESVRTVVDDAIDKFDLSSWNILKNKTSARDSAIEHAEKAARDAIQKIEQCELALSKAVNNINHDDLQSIRKKVKTLTDHINRAKDELYKNKDMSTLSEKFWKKVESARNYYVNEIESIFPGLNLSEKKLTLSNDDLDLFLIHAYSHVLAYQKELQRIQLDGELRLKRAIDGVKGADQSEAVQSQLEFHLDKEKRNLALENQKKVFKIRTEMEKELRQQLKRQSEAHVDHLQDALAQKEAELKRSFSRELDEKLTSEKAAYKLQLASMLGKLKGMDAALKARADSEKCAHQAQELWAACQALWASVRTGEPGVHWRNKLRPLKNELKAVSRAAADGDELVFVVLQNLPKEVEERGVYPEDALRERFINVEKIARKLAIVPEEGATVPIYILSYLQYLFIMRPDDPITKEELQNEKFDFSKLDTYDILNRAKYFIDRGDFTQSVKYMNLLQGQARKISNDWIKEARLLLETQQAANTLMAHAAASGLLYL